MRQAKEGEFWKRVLPTAKEITPTCIPKVMISNIISWSARSVFVELVFNSKIGANGNWT